MKRKTKTVSDLDKDGNFPLDIAQFATGEKVGEVIIQVQNRRGALSDVIQVMEENGFDLFKLFGGSTESEARDLTYLIFFEAKNAKLAPEVLRKRIASLDPVVRVSVSKTANMFVDTKSVPIFQQGRRSVIMGDIMFGEILRSVERAGPSGIAELRWAGVQTAIKRVAWIRSTRFGENHNSRDLFSKTIDLVQSVGWGIFKVEFQRAGKPDTVIVRDSYEATVLGQSNAGQGCVIMGGFLTGAFQTIFNTQFSLAEKNCISRGDKTCVFHFKYGGKSG